MESERRQSVVPALDVKPVGILENVDDRPQARLYPTVLQTVVARIAEAPDFAGVLIACHTDNTASVRGILKGGFSYLTSSFTIGFLGGRLAFTRFYADGGPKLQRADGGGR